MSEPELIVLRRDLIQALRSLQDAARGKTPPDLLLYSEPGRLLLSVGDLKTRIPAEGTLPGMAYISGLLVKILPKMIPVSSEISITRVEDRIAFGVTDRLRWCLGGPTQPHTQHRFAPVRRHRPEHEKLLPDPLIRVDAVKLYAPFQVRTI